MSDALEKALKQRRADLSDEDLEALEKFQAAVKDDDSVPHVTAEDKAKKFFKPWQYSKKHDEQTE